MNIKYILYLNVLLIFNSPSVFTQQPIRKETLLDTKERHAIRAKDENERKTREAQRLAEENRKFVMNWPRMLRPKEFQPLHEPGEIEALVSSIQSLPPKKEAQEPPSTEKILEVLSTAGSSSNICSSRMRAVNKIEDKKRKAIRATEEHKKQTDNMIKLLQMNPTPQ